MVGLDTHEASLSDEEQRVRLWRFDQLVANGYAATVAARLAADRSVDLELARRLVAVLGCPPRLAARIV